MVPVGTVVTGVSLKSGENSQFSGSMTRINLISQQLRKFHRNPPIKFFLRISTNTFIIFKISIIVLICYFSVFLYSAISHKQVINPLSLSLSYCSQTRKHTDCKCRMASSSSTAAWSSSWLCVPLMTVAREKHHGGSCDKEAEPQDVKLSVERASTGWQTSSEKPKHSTRQ